MQRGARAAERRGGPARAPLARGRGARDTGRAFGRDYPRITSVDRHRVTIESRLIADPQLMYNDAGDAVALVYLQDGTGCIAVGGIAREDQHGEEQVGEWVADRFLDGCRATVTGRWAALEAAPGVTPDPIRRIVVIDDIEHHEDGDGPYARLWPEPDEPPEHHPAPRSSETVGLPGGDGPLAITHVDDEHIPAGGTIATAPVLAYDAQGFAAAWWRLDDGTACFAWDQADVPPDQVQSAELIAELPASSHIWLIRHMGRCGSAIVPPAC